MSTVQITEISGSRATTKAADDEARDQAVLGLAAALDGGDSRQGRPRREWPETMPPAEGVEADQGHDGGTEDDGQRRQDQRRGPTWAAGPR